MRMNDNVFENVARISFASALDDYENKDKVSASAERFFQFARTTCGTGHLGLKVVFDRESREILTYIFSDSGCKATPEDFRWMFRDLADVVPAESVQFPSLCGGSGKTYALLTESEDPDGEGAEFTIRRREELGNVFDFLLETGAVFWIVTGSGYEEGRLMVELPCEMSLRLKCSLSMVFPGMKVSEVSADGTGTAGSVTGGTMAYAMMAFLYLFLARSRECKEELPESFLLDYEDDFLLEETEASPKIEEPHTPIEELELSVRAYNCLKRAGIHTVEQLRTFREDDLMKVRSLGRKCTMEVLRALSDFSDVAREVPLESKSYMSMLEDLIGLDEVKKQVRKIAAFAKMKKVLSAGGNDHLDLALNMEFAGNPGTAKTTVARILAGVFFEQGLLSSKEILEVGRADLVARYEGQTADNVKKIFARAKGKLLFIDEAYSLLEEHRGEFGDEAISTIVQEMENHREETVVIFAGYPDEMREFFARNAGLRSRVPFHISFRDYTVEEMVQITEREAGRRGFSISPDAKDKVGSICGAAIGAAETGNGRFCRNLTESAMLNFAERCFGPEAGDGEPEMKLLPEDFSWASETKQEEKRIGFH